MRILIAVDDSECSAAAVEEVLKREWGSDVKCRIVTVVEPIMFAVDPMYALSMAEAEQEQLAWLQKMVDSEVARVKEALVSEVTGVVMKGRIAESIIEEAIRWKADLIVLGSHGRRGVQKFILGSVSEKVVIGAPCSVQIVRIKKPQTSPMEPIQKVESASVK